jgi:thiol:disulfide interchange protein DsbA
MAGIYRERCIARISDASQGYTASLVKRIISRIAATLLFAAACAMANAQPLAVAGRDYVVLDSPRAAATGEAIEVIEFFYYGCPVCYDAQPHIARWLAREGASVAFTRVPQASSPQSENFALTYYALEASGHLERLHGPVYENHHFGDPRLDEEAKLLDWLGRNGADAEAFRRLRDSEEVRARVAAGRRSFEAYNVRGVPAFAVDGRFVTSARLAGGVKEMMDVVTHLVERARRERRGK